MRYNIVKGRPEMPGIAGARRQLKNADKVFGPGHDITMGRKFESERAIWYDDHGMLLFVNSTSKKLDLKISGLGTIQHVELKWSRYGFGSNRSRADNLAKDIAEQAGNHPAGTFLLEANEITSAGYAALVEQGGQELPWSYR